MIPPLTQATEPVLYLLFCRHSGIPSRQATRRERKLASARLPQAAVRLVQPSLPQPTKVQHDSLGRPHIHSNYKRSAWRLSMAHCAGLSGLALAEDQQIGLDMEPLDRNIRRPVALAKRLAMPTTSSGIQLLMEFSAQEARIKALQRGIAGHLGHPSLCSRHYPPPNSLRSYHLHKSLQISATTLKQIPQSNCPLGLPVRQFQLYHSTDKPPVLISLCLPLESQLHCLVLASQENDFAFSPSSKKG